MNLKRRIAVGVTILAICLAGPFVGWKVYWRSFERSAKRLLDEGGLASIKQSRYLVQSGSMIGQSRSSIEPLVDQWSPIHPKYRTSSAYIGDEEGGLLGSAQSVHIRITYGPDERCTKAELVYDSPTGKKAP